MKNKAVWIIFGIISQFLSWVLPLIYAVDKYGAFIKKNSLVMVFMVAAGLGIVLMMKALKETAETGYGLFRKIARSIRFVIPLLILFVFVLVVNNNIADIYDLILITLGSNILAQPFSVLSYYFGPQYIQDTSADRILKKLK